MCRHVDIWDSFLKRQENNLSLNCITTGTKNGPYIIMWNARGRGAEKMKVFQKRIFTKKSWCCSFGHQRKSLKFFFSFYRTIPINAEVYHYQLNKLNDSLKQKRPKLTNKKDVVFHQDNVRPHTSLVTCQKLLHLEWDILQHRTYSLDPAPSVYYLFRSLLKFLAGKTFTSNDGFKNHVNQFLPAKNETFMSGVIMLLPERWEKVLCWTWI